jgi:hypothetical protein
MHSVGPFDMDGSASARKYGWPVLISVAKHGAFDAVLEVTMQGEERS